MIEAEWHVSENPIDMLKSLKITSKRKLLYFCTLVCRRYGQFATAGMRQAIESAERKVDGDFSPDPREPPQWTVPRLLTPTSNAYLYYVEDTFSSALEFFRTGEIRHVDWLSRVSAMATDNIPAEWKLQAEILREIFANPFHPIAFDPYWRSSTVHALATGIYFEKAFDRLPILADALQDAGCDSEEILNHFRQGGQHCRGCWALDLVLGKS